MVILLIIIILLLLVIIANIDDDGSAINMIINGVCALIGWLVKWCVIIILFIGAVAVIGSLTGGA